MLDDVQIHLGYDAFATALAEVHGAGTELDEVETRARREVGHLVDGGWSGAAADSFAEAWQEWSAGSAQVRAALEQIGSSLASTQRDLADRDVDRARLLTRLAARLAS